MSGDSPAYPVTTKSGMFVEGGLTKRELISAMALQGELANSADGGWACESHQACAVKCVKFADALIAELSKEP